MGIYAQAIKTNIKNVGLRRITADIYIQIIDDESQQPKDGGGVTVFYALVTNYIPGPEQSVFIPGQSALVFSGVILDKGWDDQIGLPGEPLPPTEVINSVDVNILRIEGATNPATPGCNLTFLNADIKKESAPGAADGSIRLNVSTSYYPLAYSLDNINFQTLSLFEHLSTGNKTIYIKDANGCSIEVQLFVGLIEGLLISDPSVTVENNISRWNAAFNPVVFKFQRKDFEVLGIANSSGNVNVAINADLSLVASGDFIYIHTPLYEGTFKVVSKQNNTVVLNCPFVNIDSGGFANVNSVRRYYKVLVKITFAQNGRLRTLISTNTPGLSGITKSDLSTFLQTLLLAKNDSNYTAVNYRDINLSASYQISYAETWEGHSPEYVNISTPYYVLFAAGQIGQKMSRNLSEFVPFKSLTNPENLARWVTDFKEPCYTIGMPFDIGFIYSEYLLGLNVVVKMQTLDINRNPTSIDSIFGYLQNEDASYLLNEDASRLIIAEYPILSTTGQIVPEQLGLNRLLINAVFPEKVYYLAVTLSYDTTNITKTQIIKVNKDPGCNSVYLRWIGLTGSWNYWQFSYNQQHDLDVQNSVIVKRFVEDWQSGDTLEDVISKAAAEKITVTAEDISIDDIKGLRSIKVSPKVQMYRDGVFQTVVVNTGTFAEFETLYGVYQFKITFSLPSLNIQTQ